MLDLGCILLTGVGIVGFLALLKYYMAGGVYYGKETMIGKTIVITGANTGIGKETVRELATRGARIIMGCRNMEKAKKACDDILRLTNNKNVEYRKLDLSSFDSVRAFANSILETESRIDVLINNAGLYAPSRNVTVDGFEEMIQTNHYGPITYITQVRALQNYHQYVMMHGKTSHIFPRT